MKRIPIYITVTTILLGLGIHCSYTPPVEEKALDEDLKNIITEKVRRAGYYTLVSKQAEKDGYGELAVYFSEIAEEEINHIKALSVLNIKTQRTTKKNVQKAMKMEKNASRHDYQRILRSAKRLNDEEMIKIFEQIIEDEERHFLGLRGFIKKKRVK